MKEIIATNRFKRELKRIKKRGWNLTKLLEFIDLIATDDVLPLRSRPHKLVGEYEGLWECHIEPDWLLIYAFDDETVTLIATGSHSDLFK